MKVSRHLAFALFLSSSTFTSAALSADSCEHVKNGLKAQYPSASYVLETGFCTWWKPEDADNWAKYAGCPKVLGEGALPIDSGHRTVTNWLPGLPSQDWNSYLDYCAGFKGPAPASNPANGEALKKQIEELRGQLKR